MLAKNGPQAPDDTGPTVLMRLPESAAKVAQLLEENFAPGMTPVLQRVKMPTGGRLTWTLESSTGEQEVAEIIGVILHQNLARTYWAGAVETGKSPDCQSPDGFTGYGSPGGVCKDCPLNKWGSNSKGGRAKACTQKHMVYLLRSGELAPLLISLSPGSLEKMREYDTRLFSEGLSLREVVTSFRLERDKNAVGQDFSKAAPVRVAVLTAEDSAKVRAIGQALSRVVQDISVSEDGDLDPPGDGSLPKTSFPWSPLPAPAAALPSTPGHTKPEPEPEPPLTSWRWGKLVSLPELAYSANGSPVVLLQVSDGLGHQEEMIAVGDLAEQLNLFPVGAELKLRGEYRSTSRKGEMVNTFWITSFERVPPREQPAPTATPDKDDFPL